MRGKCEIWIFLEILSIVEYVNFQIQREYYYVSLVKMIFTDFVLSASS
jgi:hypothetical protein